MIFKRLRHRFSRISVLPLDTVTYRRDCHAFVEPPFSIYVYSFLFACLFDRKWNRAQYQNIVYGEWFEGWHDTSLSTYTGYDDTESPDIDM